MDTLVEHSIANEPNSTLATQPSARWRRLFALSLVLVYLATAGPVWYQSPDSALYLMLGQNLASGQGYTLWGEPHVHVPPGYPLVVAALTTVGLGSIYWLSLSMVLMGLAAMWLCYRTLREMVDPQLALCVTAIVSLSFAMHQAAAMLLSDVPYLLLMWIGLYCYFRSLRTSGWWLEAGTLALLVGCGFRITGCAIALAAAVGLWLQPREHNRWRARLNGLAIVLVFAVGGLAVKFVLDERAAGRSLPSYASAVEKIVHASPLRLLARASRNTLETGDYLGNLFTSQPIDPWAAVVVFWLPIALGMAVAIRRRELLGLCVAVGYLGAILPITPVITRYLLPIAPLLVLYYIEGIRWIISLMPAWRRHAPRVAIACAVVLVAINLPKVARGIYWQHRPTAARDYRERALRTRAAKALRQHAKPGDKFVTDWDQTKLSFLSKVASAPMTEREFRGSKVTKVMFEQWYEQGIRFIVQTNRATPIQHDELRKLCRKYGYAKIFNNDAYLIYAAPSQRIAIDIDAQTRQAKAKKQAAKLARLTSLP